MSGRVSPGVVLLVGAVAFALLRGVLGVTADAIPLLLGLVLCAAGAAQPRRGSWGAALVLVVWGLAVLGVRHGPLPGEREGAVFLAAVGAGLLAGAAVTPPARRTDALLGGAVTAFWGGIAFAAAYDERELLGWIVWTALLAAWGLRELVRDRAGARRRR